ncbi:hypothetical protein [Kistimonas asteriae]|uniref:hypothetical protein n=1 Tax=Kistimonas asteriae TaxID=517724 RepID=UPI001BA6D072|nr:hypothetical protein [Kistimonas asteriae]
MTGELDRLLNLPVDKSKLEHELRLAKESLDLVIKQARDMGIEDEAIVQARNPYQLPVQVIMKDDPSKGINADTFQEKTRKRQLGSITVRQQRLTKLEKQLKEYDKFMETLQEVDSKVHSKRGFVEDSVMEFFIEILCPFIQYDSAQSRQSDPNDFIVDFYRMFGVVLDPDKGGSVAMKLDLQLDYYLASGQAIELSVQDGIDNYFNNLKICNVKEIIHVGSDILYLSSPDQGGARSKLWLNDKIETQYTTEDGKKEVVHEYQLLSILTIELSHYRAWVIRGGDVYCFDSMEDQKEGERIIPAIKVYPNMGQQINLGLFSKDGGLTKYAESVDADVKDFDKTTSEDGDEVNNLKDMQRCYACTMDHLKSFHRDTKFLMYKKINSYVRDIPADADQE